MKVAIDSGPLKTGHSVRGIGAHTRELIFSLKNYVSGNIDISIEVFKKTPDFQSGDELNAYMSSSLRGNRGLKSAEDVIESFDFLSAKPSKLSSYDVIHYTSFHPYFLSLPFKKPASKVILTIHDLIPLIYPHHYAPGVRGRIRFLVNKFLIMKNVDKIITITETSKKDICRFLGVKASMVEVIYIAPPKELTESKITLGRLDDVKKKYNLPEKFAMYLGDVNYNKNIPTLVEACKIANIPLVIVGKQALDIEVGNGLDTLVGPMDYIRFLFGKPHPETAHYEDLQNKFVKFKVIRLGYLSYKDLSVLFKLASVYVQPSFYEGFGIPLVEAFHIGCPVVASRTQALVEIGEGAALFADPNNPNDFAAKINNVLKDKILRNQLIETGKIQVKNFTWEKVARETLEVYKNV